MFRWLLPSDAVNASAQKRTPSRSKTRVKTVMSDRVGMKKATTLQLQLYRPVSFVVVVVVAVVVVVVVFLLHFIYLSHLVHTNNLEGC